MADVEQGSRKESTYRQIGGGLCSAVDMLSNMIMMTMNYRTSDGLLSYHNPLLDISTLIASLVYD